MNIRKNEWENSYKNKDNFVFYPHEEVIRFISKYFNKKISINEVKKISSKNDLKGLDLGCGIGRHVIYMQEMKIDAYGIDLSEVAVEVAVSWAKEKGMTNADEHILQGDVCALPWQEETFDCIVSHGVLDSIPFDVALRAIGEVSRVLKPGGLFYFDLISGDDNYHSREFEGEEIVETAHEQGTIQSYFNFRKVRALIDVYQQLELVDCTLIRRENVMAGGFSSRYHLVVEKRV